MLLGGFWHGANWNFAVWGLYHGVLLVLHRAVPFPLSGAVGRCVGRVLTFLAVLVGWVFFRAATLTYAAGFLRALAGAPAVQATPYTVGWYLTSELWLALIAGAVGSTPWVPTLASWIQRQARPWVFATEALSVGALVALFGASITQVAAGTYNPFIYFQF